MSKSLVLTMTPQLGLTSQNPSAYYWRPEESHGSLRSTLTQKLWSLLKNQSKPTEKNPLFQQK